MRTLNDASKPHVDKAASSYYQDGCRYSSINPETGAELMAKKDGAKQLQRCLMCEKDIPKSGYSQHTYWECVRSWMNFHAGAPQRRRRCKRLRGRKRSSRHITISGRVRVK